jgi:hypothetical protein
MLLADAPFFCHVLDRSLDFFTVSQHNSKTMIPLQYHEDSLSVARSCDLIELGMGIPQKSNSLPKIASTRQANLLLFFSDRFVDHSISIP